MVLKRPVFLSVCTVQCNVAIPTSPCTNRLKIQHNFTDFFTLSNHMHLTINLLVSCTTESKRHSHWYLKQTSTNKSNNPCFTAKLVLLLINLSNILTENNVFACTEFKPKPTFHEWNYLHPSNQFWVRDKSAVLQGSRWACAVILVYCGAHSNILEFGH